MQNLSIVYRDINDLIPYVNNSRTHSDEQVTQIASSIKEFGFTNPILIDEQGGVIAGHGRILAAKKLKLAQVPTITLANLTEAQKKAYVLADNQIALNSGWDLDMLRLEIETLSELDFDLELLGFGDELEILLPAIDDVLDEEKENIIPETPNEPTTKLGDVWILGKHRLMCGDSLSITDVQKLMGGDLADMLLTDPPYNVAYEGKTEDKLTIKNDKMPSENFRTFLKDAFVNADTVMKAGAVFYVWHADSEGYNFRGACLDAGWQIRQCLIWNKNVSVLGRQDYHWKHEPCLYGWKDGAGHLWASDRKQTTVLNFDKPLRNGEHPTMKPVELFEYCMLNNTKGDDIVLDCFGGSGTTMIACEKHKRRARLMELDPKYCDVIINRWQDFTGRQAILEQTGQTYNSMVKDNGTT